MKNRVDHWYLSHDPVEINVLLNTGGMGDQVCRLPAIKHLLENYPHITMHAYCPTYWVEVLQHFFGRFHQLKIYPKDDQVVNFPRRAGYYFIGTGDKRHLHTTLGTHLVDYAYNILLDRQPLGAERDYLSIKVETKAKGAPYAVLTPGFTSPVRSLPGDVWNSIAAYLVTLGVTPVWLGKRAIYGSQATLFYDDVDYTVGRDMRDKTTVLEAAMIMSQASFVLGLDNGLMHVAALSDVPIIAGYSSVKAVYRLPVRHGELGWNVKVVEPDSCHGCENIMRFNYGHDFRTCYYGDMVCTKELTFDKWRERIDQVLGGT